MEHGEPEHATTSIVNFPKAVVITCLLEVELAIVGHGPRRRSCMHCLFRLVLNPNESQIGVEI